MKPDYRKIKTIEEIDLALLANKKMIDKKADLLKRKFDKAQDFYSPSTLITEGVRNVTTSLPFYGIILTLMRRIRRLQKK